MKLFTLALAGLVALVAALPVEPIFNNNTPVYQNNGTDVYVHSL